MHPANTVALFRTNKIDRADARHLQRRQRAGELVRVRHGVYVDRSEWDALDARARHLVRMRSVIPLLRPGAVFALDSAAAVLGLPRLEPWPERVHATVPGIDHDLHRVGLTLHAGRRDASGGMFHGVPFTDLSHTAVETARRGTLSNAVVLFDEALRRGEQHSTLLRRAEEAGPWGSIRLEHALAICDARHESVGESYLAARAAELACPDLEPQHEFVGPDGRVDRVDFWLPRQGIVIEFDGKQKYQDARMLQGRSGAEVVWSEKQREDRIRARGEVSGFVRVYWEHLASPDRLRSLFRQHGVPCR